MFPSYTVLVDKSRSLKQKGIQKRPWATMVRTLRDRPDHCSTHHVAVSPQTKTVSITTNLSQIFLHIPLQRSKSRSSFKVYWHRVTSAFAGPLLPCCVESLTYDLRFFSLKTLQFFFIFFCFRVCDCIMRKLKIFHLETAWTVAWPLSTAAVLQNNEHRLTHRTKDLMC